MTALPPSEAADAAAVPMFRKSMANLVALACIQGSNAILPLIAYPLILGVVGADKFSKVVVSESIMLVVLALVIYSFDVEGVSSIAGLDVRADIKKISAVFSDILVVRLLILFACVVALVALSPFLDATTFSLLAAWMLFPLSYVLQSTWFFQGIERNVVPAVVIVASRCTCLVLIRILIVRPQDFHRAPIIIGASYATAGFILLCHARLRWGVRLRPDSLASLWTAIRRGREIFVGNLSVTLYRGSNVLILNVLSTSKAVVVYSIAEKTIKVFQAGASPLNQVFFPKLIRALGSLAAPSRHAFRVVLRYTTPQLLLLGLGAFVIAGAFGLLHDHLPGPFRSTQGHDILTLVFIMAPTVFFGVANFMFGTGGLNYLGRRAYYAKSILVTGVCNVVCAGALITAFAETGAALSFVLAEMLLFAFVARAYFNIPGSATIDLRMQGHEPGES